MSKSSESSATPRMLLGERLREDGVLTAEQLEDALRLQRETSPRRQLGHILIEQEYATAQQVTRALAESFGLAFTHVAPDMVQPGALQVLPSEYQEQYNLLPMSQDDSGLTVAMEQFTDVFLIEEIGRRCDCPVRIIAAEAENIRTTRREVMAIAHHEQRGSKSDEVSPLDEVLSEISVNDLQVIENAPVDDSDLEATATESPIVKLVNYIIKRAVDLSASDIHIDPDEMSFRVRYRVDGELVTSVNPPSRLLPAVVSRIKILAGMDISERRLPQDGSVTVTIAERSVDLRVSTMAARFGEKVVLRIFDRNASARSLGDLEMEPDMYDRFRGVIREPNGIVLVTGPTGSGKTTTLYSVLASIRSDVRNVSTVEDPVERRLSGVNQFPIHTELGFTFACALRSLLRQDPDVIMVGEIRDMETARLATQAALTGHLVLSTLHTNDAPTAIPRLINMGVEPYLVAASLRAVLAQRLVRSICSKCRQPMEISDYLAQLIHETFSGAVTLDAAYRGVGCARCREQGRLGRVAVFDLLVLSEAIVSKVARNPSLHALRQLARRQGAHGLLYDGLMKVRRGVIDLNALLEVVSYAESCVENEGTATRIAA